MNYFFPLYPSLVISARFSQSTLDQRNYVLRNTNTGDPRNPANPQINPKGLTEGMVISVDPQTKTYRACDSESDRAVGILANDSEEPFKNSNSNQKFSLYLGGIHKIYLYERVLYDDNQTSLSYEINDLLYVSPYGTLTKEESLGVNSNRPVGFVLGFEGSYLVIRLYDFSPEADPSSALNPNVLTRQDVVDSLSSSDTQKPLSANQGRILSSSIGELRVKTYVSKLDSVTMAKGYVTLPEEPLYKGDVRVVIHQGSVQLNYFAEGYDPLIMGLADFSVGDKNGDNPSRIYFRSDGGLGGYNSGELVDGSLEPNKLPLEGSIFIIEYQAS